MDKSLKETVLEQLKGIKVALGIIKDEPTESKVTTKDNKELKFVGELKEGVEIKCNDVALENGTYELSDDRKMVVENGKFVKFEAVSTGDEPNKEIVELKATIETQKAEIEKLKVEFKAVLDATNNTVKVVESIAVALEGVEPPAGGGGSGEGLTKAEWVQKRATKSE